MNFFQSKIWCVLKCHRTDFFEIFQNRWEAPTLSKLGWRVATSILKPAMYMVIQLNKICIQIKDPN